MTGRHTTRPLPPRALRALGRHALETALNRVVTLDPELHDDLAALEGKRLDIDLRGPDLIVCVRVVDHKLNVTTSGEDLPGTLRVSATPGSFLGMLLRGDRDSNLPGHVEVAGDAELARRLQKLARNYAPDFEAAFASVFGDVIGVPLAHLLQQAFAHLRESLGHAVDDSADWLREEARLGVAPGEMNDFLDGVEELTARTDRLEARLAHYAKRKAPHS